MDFATYQQQRFMHLMSSVGVASLDLLGGMGASLGLLNLQMAELRASNATQVALQQLILQRDEIQQHLEELVYQGQKMVEAFADPGDKTPAIQKGLLLRSFYMCVTKAGIGTAAIRGLQNKKVFDALISEVKSQYRQLGHDPAIRKAVANEEAAEKRQLAAEAAEQQRRLEEERRRLEEERRNTPSTLRFIVEECGLLVSFKVKIDGKLVGELPCGNSLDVTVKPGEHRLQVYGGGAFCGKELVVDVPPGDFISWKVGYTWLGAVRLEKV